VQVAGMTVLKRVTLVCKGQEIIKVFYPVFPPNKSAEQVIEWLKARQA
jgi:peroxiredoxin